MNKAKWLWFMAMSQKQFLMTNTTFSALMAALLFAPLAPWAAEGKHADRDALAAGFANPPDSARPHCLWMWMNGNITREGITADMEAMAGSGIGGAMIYNIAGPIHNCDTPAGPADYLGPQWLDLMKHAASEAGRLGIELCMHNCAGWATTGGPWITPELAMQKLVSSERMVDGGRRIEEKLPQPEVVLGHYRDIAVFAMPAALDGGFRVDQWPSKAGQRGGRNGRQPDLKPLPKDAAIPLASIINVTRHLRADGTLAWDAPPGRWKIVRLGHTPTGKINLPGPASGTGLEIDKLRRDGMDVHWQHGIQPVLDHLGPLVGKGFKKLEIDSYEAGLHHWTPRLREEFQKRRGYDPTPYLLALTGRAIDDGPTTDRFLWDIRRTFSDLFADNYYGYFADLCHQHGLEFATEPYTSCFEGLQVAAKADIPMAEFWADGGYSFSMRLSASLAHIHGRPIAAAEAFTAGPELSRWLHYPGSLKRVGDLAWSEGINRFVISAYAHQPWRDVAPGMNFGQYGIQFERTTTWWKPGSAWLKYIARSQFLLQSGEFSADVLCFAGNAAPNGAADRDDVKAAGYDYDGCGTDILSALKVIDGDVELPSGKRYKLLVLPDHPFHTPDFACKLRELVRDGAKVVGPKPLHTPSLGNFPASEEEVRAIGEEVWGTCDGKTVTSNRFGKGQVFWGVSPAEVLAGLNIKPAVQVTADADKFAWIQRRTKDAELFFVSNQSANTINIVAGFRAAGRQPEFWDAEQGTIRPAPGWTVTGEQVNVPLDLAPEKSVFVVFRDQGKPEVDPYVRVDGPVQEKPANPLTSPWFDGLDAAGLRAWNNGSHILQRASGKTNVVEVAGLTEPLTLQGPWTLRFPPNRGAPAEASLEKLISWSEHVDPGIRYFSGTATTSIRFDLPVGFHKDRQEVWLDLGEVAVMAEVRLNGKNLGVLWHRPFRVEISKALHAGSNTLEVDVTNLWVNRLIGDEQQPADCEWTGKHLTRWPDWFTSGKPRPQPSRVTFATWKHWNANDPLLPSGLIGPVTLRAARLLALP
jgi:hypothetical protein